MERLFQGVAPKTADLVVTILASQAIETVLERTGGRRFDILVRPEDLACARFHLDSYARENPKPGLPSPEPPVAVPLYSISALAAALILALVHMGLTWTQTHDPAVFAFGASPYFLAQGQTFRAITALFLHADASHLLGNMAGLIILAGPLTRITGPGTGLFLLLSAAATGNLISNSLSLDSRLSIGASTAVMAAAGLLSVRQALTSLPRLSFWRPLTAGLILMAFLSHGPRTDVSAHLFGFGAGAGTGLLAFPLFHVWHRPWMEPAALALVLAILGAALISGLVAM